jgi:exopolysaccharide biosynthesis polyprenyl glycosylphosphotransferase
MVKIQRDLRQLNFLYKWFSYATLRTILHIGLRVIDLAVVCISAAISLIVISSYSGEKTSVLASSLYVFALLLIWALLLELSYLPKVPRTTRYRSIFLEFMIFNAVSFLGLLLIKYIFGLPEVSLSHFFVFLIVNQILLFITRLTCYKLFKRYRSKGYDLHNVLVIADQFSDEMIENLINRKEWGYRILAIATNSKLIRAKYWDKAKIISYKGNIRQIIICDIIDEVIYSASVVDKEILEDLSTFCNEVGVTFTIASSFTPLDPVKLQLEALYHPTSLSFNFTPTNNISLLIKSLVDKVFSSMVLLFLSLLFLLIAVLIKLDSKGPVLFKQKRIGLHGRKFIFYKFRTMVHNAEALRPSLEALNETGSPTFKIKKDPRITRIGRFLRRTGLDELPQFYNVLRGEMSIMGPRPPLESEIAQYKPWQLRRLSVKPGITCIWQVAPNRHSIVFDNWIKMDLHYIDNWSIKTDAILFFKTIYSMINRQGY